MTERPIRRRKLPRSGAPPTRDPTVRDRLEVAAVRGIVAGLGALGPERASALMGRIWRRLAPLNRRHARADRHLADAMPELSGDRRREILGDMWDNLGRTAAEAFLLPQIITMPDLVEEAFEGIDGLSRADGAIFASLHSGNWELAAWGIRLAGFRTAAVYQPLKNPLADAVLKDLRLPIYDAGLYPRDASTALRLRSLARSGVAVGMLADLRDATGAEVSFFGRPAYATTLPAMLARRLSLPLVAGRVVRLEGLRFRIEAAPVAVPRTEDVDADILAATEALTARFEAWIRQYPSQWMWAHRKWIDSV